MKKETFVTVNIKERDRERLREIAEQERRSMAQQISHFLDQYQLQKESA